MIGMPEEEVMNATVSEILTTCLEAHRQDDGESTERSTDECEICKLNKFLNSLGNVQEGPPSDFDKAMFDMMRNSGMGILLLVGGVKDFVYATRFAFWMGYRTAINSERTRMLNESALMRDVEEK